MGMGNIATTGMQASMSDMDIISNNIANANTNGFKKSSASFADIFPSGTDAASAQIGLGVSVSGVTQDFTPGGTVITNLPTDLSINKNGFFIMTDATTGQTSYTRAGQFEFNQGYLMSGNTRLQGYPSVNNTIPSGSSPTDLLINTSAMAAKATTTVTQQQLNLNANDTAPSSSFSVNDNTSYNFSTTTSVYDSLGNSNLLTLYYIKNSADSWNVNAYVNGSSVGTGTLSFATNGSLSSATGLSSLSFNPSSGATSPQTIDVSMSGATQYANTDSASPFTVDGYTAGTYQGYTIDNNGMVNVQYSNKQTQLAGQVAIATFQSAEGLQDVGNMSWIATSASGQPVINQANSVTNISQGSLELSNVDLAQELVNLINVQNTFQANAQVEQTYNSVMQTVTKL